jgi:heme A synthase
MTQIHAVVGLVTLIVAAAMLIWNGLRLTRNLSAPSLRMVLVGLLDLQVLLGLITFVLHPTWGRWLLHPLFMLVAVGIGHVLLKDARPARTQLLGYFLVLAFLVLGVWLP